MKFLILILMIISLAHAQEFRKRIYQNQFQLDESDIKLEIDFGRSLAGRLLSKYPLLENQSMHNYLNKLGASVVAKVGRSELKYYFGVIQSEEINAYACPGGHILLTKGLMKQLENEAQLVGVLAHEIAHVNFRHVINQLGLRGKDQSVAQAATSLIGGATAPFSILMQTMMDKAETILFSEGLMQTDEVESDIFAIEVMSTLNYSVAEYFKLFSKLMRHNKDTSVVSKTHPSFKDRIINMKNEISKIKIDKKSEIFKERFLKYVDL
jgi:beta-barrel assembly-enhancing protease